MTETIHATQGNCMSGYSIYLEDTYYQENLRDYRLRISYGLLDRLQLGSDGCRRPAT
jgi:hypothetical protein